MMISIKSKIKNELHILEKLNLLLQINFTALYTPQES